MRVGIIGGGVSGLAAASHFLQCGIACTVFDTGKRGVGGRCSSRTKTQFPGAVDHAAQFVESSGRSDAFDAFIPRLRLDRRFETVGRQVRRVGNGGPRRAA